MTVTAEKYKAHTDQFMAWRDALLDNLKKAQTAYDDACKAYEEAKAAADKAASPEITQPTETTPPSNSAQPAEATQPTGSSAPRQKYPAKLHQASELEQRQASRYDRWQAREHGRRSAERNRTRRNRRRRVRNNRHSYTPHQELKIADRAFCLHQSTSPETKEARFPNPGKRAPLLEKTDGNATVS